jgi:ubiquinone/menaquinone biosynthesis C-methylase UbiE
MSIPTWFLDELAFAGSEHLDPAYVPGYDRKAGTNPAHDLAQLDQLSLKSAHTLVDLGAGTGSLALAVAPLCRRVVAVDISPMMLEQLHRKAKQLNITNITT